MNDKKVFVLGLAIALVVGIMIGIAIGVGSVSPATDTGSKPEVVKAPSTTYLVPTKWGEIEATCDERMGNLIYRSVFSATGVSIWGVPGGCEKKKQ